MNLCYVKPLGFQDLFFQFQQLYLPIQILVLEVRAVIEIKKEKHDLKMSGICLIVWAVESGGKKYTEAGKMVNHIIPWQSTC